MNGVYLRALSPDEYATRLVGYLREQGVDWPEERVRAAAPIVQEKIGRFGRVRGIRRVPLPRRRAGPGAPRRADPRARRPRRSTVSSRGRATRSRARSSSSATTSGEKPRTVYLPIRVAVTGSRVSPGLYESLELLGSRHGARAASGGSGGGGGVSAVRDLVGDGARPDVVARRHAGAHRRVCGRDGRSAVDPRRSRAGGRRAVRDDDRARLPDALALRPDARRGAAAERRRWS